MKFTTTQLKAIEEVAGKFGVERLAMKPGIFLDGTTSLIINTNYESSEFAGMPQVGLSDGTGGIDESLMLAGEIREAIKTAFKKLPAKEKKPPRVEHDSATAKQEYVAPKFEEEVKKDEIKTETKTEGKAPEEQATQPVMKVSKCFRCGVEISHGRALELFHDDRRPECEACEEKAKEKSKEEVTLKSREEIKEKKKPMSNEIVPANTANKMTTTRPLCLEDIQKYLCPKATEAEAYMFLQLCVNRGLNPFLKEAYLIKYGDTANMVVGKDAFTRKAEESGKLDGFEAGIVILNVEGRMDEREGTIVLKDETLIGGYAKVKRKDMAGEFVNKVSLQEFNRNQGNWKTMPAVMIRKCALVGALREAFTKELGGCYDSAEVAENIEG